MSRIYGTSFEDGVFQLVSPTNPLWTFSTTGAVISSAGGYGGGKCLTNGGTFTATTFTGTKAGGFSKVRPTVRMFIQSIGSAHDLFTCGPVVIRPVAGSFYTSFALRINGVQVATFPVTVSPANWNTYQASVDLAAAGTVTFVVNGVSYTWNGDTVLYTATSFIWSTGLDGGSSQSNGYRVDDVTVNDETGSSNTGLAPIVRGIPATISAIGSQSDFSTTGGECMSQQPVNNGFLLSGAYAFSTITQRRAYVGEATAVGNTFVHITDANGNLLFSVDSGRAYSSLAGGTTAPRLIPVRGYDRFVVIGQSQVASETTHSVIDTLTGAVFTPSANTRGEFVAALTGELFFGTGTGTLVENTSAGALIRNITGAYGFPNETFIFPSQVTGEIYCPLAAGNVMNAIAPSTGAVTAVTGAVTSSNVPGGAVENPANSRLYWALGSIVAEIDMLTHTVLQTFALGSAVYGLKNYARGGAMSIAGDFANGRVFAVRADRDIRMMTIVGGAVASLGQAPVGTYGLSLVIANGWLFAIGDTEIRMWNLTTLAAGTTITFDSTVGVTYTKVLLDGNYFWFTTQNRAEKFDTVSRTIVPASKLASVRGMKTGTAVNLCAVKGVGSLNQKDRYTLSVPTGSWVAVDTVNVGLRRAMKTGAPTAYIEGGVTLGGTDILVRPTGLGVSPGDFVCPLMEKSAGVPFTVPDLSTMELCLKATT